MRFGLLLIILIPIALLLMATLVVLFFAIKIKSNQRKEFNKFKNCIPNYDITPLSQTVNRIHIIANNNPNYKDIERKLNTIYNDYQVAFNRFKNLVKELEIIADSKHLQIEDFKKNSSQIQKKIKDLDSIKSKFNQNALQLTHQDEYLRNEFTFYQKNLRKVARLYSDKRILLDKIAPEIDKLNKDIRKQEKQFEKSLQSGNSQDANTQLRKYSILVVKYTQIINEGASIFAYLYKQIPSIAEKLKKLYLTKKEDLKGKLDHINFKFSLQKIIRDFNLAIENYKKLKIDKTKNLIKNILKAFKNLENMINFEIDSRNLFTSNYQKLIEQIKFALKSYTESKAQIKEMSKKEIVLTHEIIEQYDQVKQISKNLDQQAIDFSEIIHTNKKPFSSIVSRMKILASTTSKLLDELNILNEIIWNLNIEELSMKNKFKRSEAALHEIIAISKNEDIQLSKKELGNFNQFINEKTNIINSIKVNGFNPIISKKISSFSEKINAFYASVNGQAQIAIHVKNMLSELSHQRALDFQLNLTLQKSEKNCLDGKYAEALNSIIRFLNDKRG